MVYQSLLQVPQEEVGELCPRTFLHRSHRAMAAQPLDGSKVCRDLGARGAVCRDQSLDFKG